MPAKSVTMSENGRANYRNCLDKKVYPILGNVKMPEITPAQITALLLDIQATGKAHATVIKSIRCCTACLGWHTWGI